MSLSGKIMSRSSRLLAIDPGSKSAGYALFVGTRLSVAGYMQGADAAEVAHALQELPPVDEIVIEVPQIYVGAKQKGRQADLIAVAFAAGCYRGAFLSAALTQYLPARWKGQLPKDVVEARVKENLGADIEKVILPKNKALRHNVFDAVGIGLFHIVWSRRDATCRSNSELN